MILVKLNIQEKLEVMWEFEGNEEERKENTKTSKTKKKSEKHQEKMKAEIEFSFENILWEILHTDEKTQTTMHTHFNGR